MKLRKIGRNGDEFVVICMAKRSDTNADAFRKKLAREEKRKHLEGRGKSYTWGEVKQMAQVSLSKTAIGKGIKVKNWKL